MPAPPILNNLPIWPITFENGVLVITKRPKIKNIIKIGIAKISVTSATNPVETP